MPPVIAAAAITAGASIYSANQGKKAANKAQQAQDRAAEQQLQLQREQLARVEGLNQPFIQGGYSAFDALLNRFGLGEGAPQSRPSSTSPAPSGVTYQTRGRGGEQAPAGYYFGPNDQLLPIPGGTAGQQPARNPTPTAQEVQAGWDSIGFSGDAAAIGAGGFRAGSGGQTGGGVDYARVAADRPDVVAEYQRLAATADRNSPEYQRLGLDRGQEGFIDYWLGSKPAADTYQAPQVANAPAPDAPAQPAAEPAPADPNAPPNYMDMARPDAPPAPTFVRPEAMQFQDYGQGPQFTGVNWQDIEKDPGFQWELEQGLKGVNAASAARGKLRSGDAAKALQREGYGIAHSKGQDYFNRALSTFNANRGVFESNRNYGTGLTQYQQGRADNIFADDRAYDTARWQDARTYGDFRFDAERDYQTNRYDTDTNNLFRLTGLGVGAAGNVSGAGANYANNAGGIFGNQADAASAAAAARAANNSQLAGSLAGTATNLFANWGGGVRTTPTTAPATTTIDWQRAHNPFLVNTPSSIRV